MQQIGRLIALLDRHISTHKSLLELENRKTDILIKGDTAGLDSILKQEQPLIMESSNTEERRKELQKEMCIEKLTLNQIAEQFPDKKKELNDRSKELNNIIQSIKRVSGKNRKLINLRLSAIDHVIESAGISYDEELTYNKSF